MTHGPTWIPIDDWLWHLEDTENHSLKGKGIPLKPSEVACPQLPASSIQID